MLSCVLDGNMLAFRQDFLLKSEANCFWVRLLVKKRAGFFLQNLTSTAYYLEKTMQEVYFTLTKLFSPMRVLIDWETLTHLDGIVALHNFLFSFTMRLCRGTVNSSVQLTGQIQELPNIRWNLDIARFAGNLQSSEYYQKRIFPWKW